MKSILLSVLSCSISLCSFAQKLGESFNPIIKEIPQTLKIIQHPDGNYLVYGDINYYGNVASGSLIKVDQQGNLIQDFQKVYTDRQINKVIILPSGKILIHGAFKWLNGQRVGRVALLHSDGSADPTFWTDTHAIVANVVVLVESSSPDNSNYHKVADLAPNTNSFVMERLSEVTPYHFRVTGVNEQYSSTWIDGKDTTEIEPQMPLPATEITPGSFVANWTYLPGTDSCLLQVSGDNFTSFVNGYGNLVVSSGSTAVHGLEEGETYQYRVKRFKNKKSSQFSETVIVNVITEIEQSPLKVNVYPNPVSDYLSVDLPENINNADLVIYSVAGAIVGKYSLAGKASLKVDLRNLPQGVFILTISSSGMSKKYKLVRSE